MIILTDEHSADSQTQGKEELRCECSAGKIGDLALEVHLLKCMGFPGVIDTSSEAWS